MTTINLYGGPLKRTLIQRAYGLCGQSVTEFELSAEEYDQGLQCLNDIAATFPTTLGYNFPDGAYVGSPEDESGITAEDVRGLIAFLAQELGPNIGKTFAPNGPQASAMSSLLAKYNTPPMRELGRQTIRGAGNRRYGPTPFFIVDVPEDEVAQ